MQTVDHAQQCFTIVLRLQKDTAVKIIATAGCDALIFELAEKLQNAGIINAPKFRSTMDGREVCSVRIGVAKFLVATCEPLTSKAQT